MSYHKLTEKLDNFFLRSDIKDADRIIREYLDGKAVKHQLHSSMLDLEPKGEEKEAWKVAPLRNPCPDDLGDLVKQEFKWCQHLSNHSINDSTCLNGEYFAARPRWKFCPICGTPRPKVKPLRERIAEAMANKSAGMIVEHNSDKVVDFKFDWLSIADTAIKIIEQEKKK